jgi:hypothetical protein
MIVKLFFSSGFFTFDLFRDSVIFKNYSKHIWTEFFGNKLDQHPNLHNQYLVWLKDFFFKSDYLNVYDFLDFIFQDFYQYSKELSMPLIDKFNIELELGGSGYRFINGSLVPITNSLELYNLMSLKVKDDIDKFFSSGYLYSMAFEEINKVVNPDMSNGLKLLIQAMKKRLNEINERNETFKKWLDDEIKEKLGKDASAYQRFLYCSSDNVEKPKFGMQDIQIIEFFNLVLNFIEERNDNLQEIKSEFDKNSQAEGELFPFLFNGDEIKLYFQLCSLLFIFDNSDFIVINNHNF